MRRCLQVLVTLFTVSLPLAAVFVFPTNLVGQEPPQVHQGQEVTFEVRNMYQRGMEFLARTQKEDGTWPGQAPQGVAALCLMSFLASGEDPNFGKYSRNIRAAIRALIRAQNPKSGYIPGNMYEHGFALLALSEAYGAVDDTTLWTGEEKTKQRSIGQAIELAIGCALKAQAGNRMGAWTYSPNNAANGEGTRADTSIAGAVLMGLLGARNAGIDVPDEAIDKGLDYYRGLTNDKGEVIYSNSFQWATPVPRSAIAALLFAVGKRKHWKEYEAVSEYISQHLDHVDSQHPFYFRYYMAQGLFQTNHDAWRKWNRETCRMLVDLQKPDGSFPAEKGGFTGGYQSPAYTTSMSLLAVAINFRYLPTYER